MPWKVYKDGSRWCVHKLDADGKKGEQVACHETEAEAEAQVRALYVNVKEFRGAFTDVMFVSELRGSYPNIPIAGDVDYELLTFGDDKPFFVTLPIGKVGVKSGNNRYYDEAWIKELERQTLSNKPIGLMGHLRPDERATAFPEEAIHWVGVARDADLLWAKGYIPPGSVRDRIQRYKAHGKAIATSIDAFGEGVWDDGLGAYRMQAASMRLNQIDLAPADRAGIPDLATIPHVTTEMESDDEPEQETVMDKLQVINEMTAEDARLLPQPVQDAIRATIPTPPEVAQLAAIRETLGLDDKADVASTIAEMRRTQEAQAKAAVTARITELATTGDKAIKLESVRGLVVEMVRNRNPQSIEAVDAAYGEIVEMESVKRLLQAEVRERMGPPQRGASWAPVAVQPGQAKYFQIPDKEG